MLFDCWQAQLLISLEKQRRLADECRTENHSSLLTRFDGPRDLLAAPLAAEPVMT